MNKLNWQSAIITPETTLLQSLQIIDEAGLKIALIVNEGGQLVGTLTDGDIRRALLNQVRMNVPVEVIMNTTPLSVPENTPRDTAVAIMKREDILHLPVIDKAHHLIDLEILDQKPAIKPNPVLIIAGGKGSRLKPLTDNCPKPLLKIDRLPILEILLQQLISAGFNTVYIAINYLGHMIQGHFGDGSKWGINISYLQETTPLGTAGAISLLPKPPEQPMLVMNADILTKIDFEHLLDHHNRLNTTATMCVRQYSHHVPFGLVNINDGIVTNITEKPTLQNFISAGIYVINPEVCEYTTKIQYEDMPNLLMEINKNNQKISSYLIREYWLDIGRHEDYSQANVDYKRYFSY